MIYLDNNASTQLEKKVFDSMLPWFFDNWANPSNGRHFLGRQAQRAIAESKKKILSCFGLLSHDVIFTSGATEANISILENLKNPIYSKSTVFCGPLEHNSISANFRHVDHSIRPLRANSLGVVDLDCVQSAKLRPNDWVILQWVNSETGAVNPIKNIGKYLKEIGCHFHVDATQTLGKILVTQEELFCSSLTLSAHKMYGPKGVGALILEKSLPYSPLIDGGLGRTAKRAGTENVAGIVGLGTAIDVMTESQVDIIAHQSRLLKSLELGFQHLPYTYTVITPKTSRASNTLLISWEGVEAKDILVELDKKNICASSGSACTSERTEISDTLRALAIPYNTAAGAVRFSIGKYNSAADIKEVIQNMEEILNRLTD